MEHLESLFVIFTQYISPSYPIPGTLEMIPLAWKCNSKQLLSKTLNSRMNIIETRAVLNIVKTDGKWAPEANSGFFFKVMFSSKRKVHDNILSKYKTILRNKSENDSVQVCFS